MKTALIWAAVVAASILLWPLTPILFGGFFLAVCLRSSRGPR